MKNKSNSYEEKLKNDPYPYCHQYNVLIGSIHGALWQQYVLHCDYPKPDDKRNIAEVKKRIGWSSRYLHIYKVLVLKKDYINGNSKKAKNREGLDSQTNA